MVAFAQRFRLAAALDSKIFQPKRKPNRITNAQIKNKKMKKEFKDGTEDQQRTTADNSTSASVEANPMLCAALSYSEKIWFGRFVTHCRLNERRYAVTWHMRLELVGFTTQQINYGLSKLAAKGLLKKETNKYCTKFYYASASLRSA